MAMTRLGGIALLLAFAPPVHADDLPAALVARPGTLPGGMVAVEAGEAYDSVRVLGVHALDRSAAVLGVRWGITPHLELAGATLIELTPAARWTREAVLRVAYAAWRGGALELVPSVTVPISLHTGVDATSTVAFGVGLRWRASDRVLVIVGDRAVPVPVRPAAALDVALDAAVIVQLDERWAVLAHVAACEWTLLGQFDRGIAPWERLATTARLVFATSERLDVGLELHGDVLHPRDRWGAVLDLTRRL